tara:strand:+ start:63 stop:266 length:204 start_codon:yes stop_codon:yes gene_type:complete
MKIIKKIQVNDFQLMVRVEKDNKERIYVIPYAEVGKFETYVKNGQLNQALELGYDVLSSGEKRITAI